LRVLLTRSMDLAKRTAVRLGELGHEAEILPLAEIRPVGNPIPSGPFDGLVFTSGLGARLFGKRIAEKDAEERLLHLPAWCVGAATAQAARESGFMNVFEGPGDARSLAGDLTADLPGASRLLYPCARDIAFDLPTALAPIAAEQVVIYEAALADPGKSALERALNRCKGGAALMYSERSAAHFVDLTRQYGLGAALQGLTLITISEKTAAIAGGNPGVRVIIAESPDETSMLARLAQ
jgi:uroporphyrinogen-III synthase